MTEAGLVARFAELTTKVHATRRWLLSLWLVGVAGCSNGPPTVGEVFGSPAPYPGIQWVHNGAPVPSSVIDLAAGPAHCKWETAALLSMGWPLGTEVQTVVQRRVFARDPNGVLTPPFGGAHNQYTASLPSDAADTGYEAGGVHLYLSPSDPSGVYLVIGASIESWPRMDPPPVCY